jgi:lipoyl-dependent peroxiredoxin
MTTSTATAHWSGTLKQGSGSMQSSSGFLDAPFTFATRFEGKTNGTTPEELIGAAIAGCFSMFLAAQLGEAGHAPAQIRTTAKVRLGDGPAITAIHLETHAEVPGASAQLFDEKVAFSKENCPVSKALAAVPEVTVKATLES